MKTTRRPQALLPRIAGLTATGAGIALAAWLVLSLLNTPAQASGPARAEPGQASPAAPLQALPRLHVPDYMGTWYQVALYPNRFQRQCVSDTTATYRQLPDGAGVEVVNRCRNAEGRIESVTGLARPSGSRIEGPLLQPAQLEVSFLPAWLRWLPIWGSYWVLDLAPDGQWALVSEPSREYLWVLARRPTLPEAQETAIRSRLQQLGFDLDRLQAHPHTPTTTP